MELSEKQVLMLLLDIVQYMFRVDELANEDEDLHLLVCIERKGLHYQNLAFLICGK